MRHLLPWLLLLLVPCLLFPGALPGPWVVSADDHLSVHHAWQTEASGHVRHPQLSDPALQFDALRVRVVDALKHGRAPLWNPDLYGGAPLLADGQSMVGSPVTWFRLLVPEDVAQDAGVYFVLVWTALGTALLAGALGLRGTACAVAGAAAMTGPFPMVWLLHPHSATFCWIPWVLWALERRRGWVVALAVAGLVGGGHPATVVHGVVLAGAWWWVRGRSLRGLLGMATGLLLSAPLWLPVADMALDSSTIAARTGSRLALSQLADLLWPGFWGHPAAGTWRGAGVWADGQLHPGWGALVLAMSAWRVRRVRWLLLAWGGCLGLAVVGLPGPFNPARIGSEGALFVALAAGFGVVRLGPWASTAAFLLVVGTGGWARHLDQGTLPADQHAPVPAAWTANLARQVGQGRVIGLSWALQPNTGALVGLRDLRGYDLPVSWTTQRLMGALNPRPRGPWYPIDDLPPLALLQFADVQAVVVPEGSPPPPGLVPMEVGLAPVSVYAVPDAGPRAWLATAAEPLGDADTSLARLVRLGDARKMPPVEGLTEPLEGPAVMIPLTVVEPGPERVSITVRGRLPDGGGRALLVLADAWDPGWRVAVDGQETDLLRVGGVFRGVVVGPESHTVTFDYAPGSWSWGLRLGAMGLFSLLLLGLGHRRRVSPATTPFSPRT